MALSDIVCIGASAGGLDTMRRIVPDLPLDATYFYVQHIAPEGPGGLGNLLNSAGPLEAWTVKEDQAIRPGTLHVAPPDHHLMIEHGRVRIVHGARENRTRPAIDPMFRSAAVAYRERVIGVVLTGLLDDGTAGMGAIQRCGGTVVIQDPVDAKYEDMPRAVQQSMEVDHCAPASEVAALLGRLVGREVGNGVSPSPELCSEVAASMDFVNAERDNHRIGELAALSCPECGGPMWEVEDPAVLRYRCHTGHAHTARSLEVGLTAAGEQALWVAIRSVEERVRMLGRLRERFVDLGNDWQVRRLTEEAEQAEQNARELRALISGNWTPRPTSGAPGGVT
ncbi:MAG: chemotaxis protein CheB [Chthoniobacterales bacterium]